MKEQEAQEKKPPRPDVASDRQPRRAPEESPAVPGRKDRLAFCQQMTGYTFASDRLLALALRHASAPGGADNNERLEFLGDAVLDLVVSEMLYREFSEWPEGALTEVKSRAVNRSTLANVARKISIDSCVVVGPGVAGRASIPPSILAGCLEAILGAIYLDGGFAAAAEVITRLFRNIIQAAARGEHDQNFKARLQEYSQSVLGQAPTFEVIKTIGPDHGKTFHVSTYIGAKEVGQGVGSSKKEAEQQAARNALDNLSNLP